MITVVVEVFINDQRTFKTIDLHDLVKTAYPMHLSAGVATGLVDKDSRIIATNHLVKFKGNLCRLDIHEGMIAIKHPKFGYLPLTKYHEECQIIK